MEPQSSSNMFPQQAPVQMAPKRKKWVAVLTLFIGLIVGAGIVAAIWLYWPKTTNPTTQSNTTNNQSSTSNNSNTSSSTSSNSAASAVMPCAYTNLKLSVGTVDGTAGTLYQHMVFTNTGTQSCTIAGYPAVFMLDATNNVLGSGAVPMTSFTPTLITLVPGATAHTAVGFPQAANFPAGTCTANSVSIRVYVPGSTSYLVQPSLNHTARAFQLQQLSQVNSYASISKNSPACTPSA